MIAKDTLIDNLFRHATETGNFSDTIKGFMIARRDTPNIIERCVMKPSAVITVQGKKRFIIGDNMAFTNEAGLSFILGMDFPADCVLLEASPEKPYCSMILELDASLIAQILSALPKEDTNSKICWLVWVRKLTLPYWRLLPSWLRFWIRLSI